MGENDDGSAFENKCTYDQTQRTRGQEEVRQVRHQDHATGYNR